MFLSTLLVSDTPSFFFLNTSMDSAMVSTCASFQGIGRSRTRNTVFLGDTSRFCTIQSFKTSQSRFILRNFKPRRTRAVLTTRINDFEESMTFHDGPYFDTPKADPKSVASIILGGGAGTRLFFLLLAKELNLLFQVEGVIGSLMFL